MSLIDGVGVVEGVGVLVSYLKIPINNSNYMSTIMIRYIKIVPYLEDTLYRILKIPFTVSLRYPCPYYLSFLFFFIISIINIGNIGW